MSRVAFDKVVLHIMPFLIVIIEMTENKYLVFFSLIRFMTMNERNIPIEIEKYEAYINEVLKSDLSNVCLQLDQVNGDLAEYQQLTKTINLLQEFKKSDQVYKTMMDIGCNYFMQTRVEDLSHILLDVGLGCYLEFNLSEALRFIETKENFLTSKQKLLREKSAKVKAHIKLMLLYMNQFYGTEEKQKKK